MLTIYFVHFLLLNSFFIQPAQTDTLVLFHGSRKEKKIALTFDACPSSARGGFDARIVKTLVDSGVPATFFLSGRWVKKHRHEIKNLASIKKFELGNHSYSHPHCTTMQEDSVMNELQRTDSLIKAITGIKPRLFRPPYAETDKRVVRIAQKLGLTTVMYDLASGDPDSTVSQERLIKRVVTRSRNGSIIVMHINGRGWHTAEALPEIISSLRKKGFMFVKVSEFCKRTCVKSDSTEKK